MSSEQRAEILDYFKYLCGPHLDPAIYDLSDEDLLEHYQLSKDA